ncbi:hypothetical protein J3R03_003655 [Actinoplanes couchii]|nr:hypothetical protein [Actinoplanes couchii]
MPGRVCGNPRQVAGVVVGEVLHARTLPNSPYPRSKCHPRCRAARTPTDRCRPRRGRDGSREHLPRCPTKRSARC